MAKENQPNNCSGGVRDDQRPVRLAEGVSQEPKQQDPSPFPLPDIIILLLINGGVDILELFADLSAPVPVIGQVILFLEPGADLLCLAITQLWFFLRKAKGTIMMSGQLVELTPLVDILPLRTVTLILAILIANKGGGALGKGLLSLAKK
jgi:hypothetical protein